MLTHHTIPIPLLASTTLLSQVRGIGLDPPLETLGLLQGGRLLNTATAVVFGLAYNAVPFLVLPLVVSLERVGPTLLEVPPICMRVRGGRCAA
jgi:ABC-type spermidine/putrescine transport system permease subunit I